MPKILNDPRERLLKEVEALLQEGGYTAVTIRAVAARCGLGVGTVYNYFPSKEAMLAQFLLEDWLTCIAAIQEVSAAAATAEPVARCIYDQLLTFAQSHRNIFQEEAARSAFTGSFGQYHTLLRSQLAAFLRPFWSSAFGADFAAEALLTWSMAGNAFCEIWGMLSPTVNTL